VTRNDKVGFELRELTTRLAMTARLTVRIIMQTFEFIERGTEGSGDGVHSTRKDSRVFCCLEG
jgi:hypothetical protein